MSKTEAKVPVDLSTMLGDGEKFHAKDKDYTVKPITLKHIKEFMEDNLSIGTQLFNVADEEAKTKVDKWLSCYAVNSKGEAMSLEKAMDDDWDVVDLRNFFKKLCDLSG